MTEDNLFYVGVDVSKAKHAVAIAEGRRHGEARYFRKIEATPSAVERFGPRNRQERQHVGASTKGRDHSA